jgi:DNA-binding CsgD family transcriptional regulator
MVGVGDVLCPMVIGREAELAALDAALAAALGGGGGLAFLTGEPGIGKSRLAKELAVTARGRGARVITGRGVPGSSSTPYRPLAEALLQALRDRPLPADSGLLSWRPALRAIIEDAAGPAAAEEAGYGAAAGATASVAVRGEAVLQLLRRLAGAEGLVLELEDLHWADPDTLAVVEYLGDNLGAEPVLCLATCRTAPASAAMAMIRRMYDRRSVVLLELRRLDAGQVAAMVRACLPGAAAETVVRVQRTADGVPFLVEELLATDGMPASFRDSVQARLAAASQDEREVLQAAAVLGRHFDWRLLTGVTGQSAVVLGRALEYGVTHLLLAVDGEDFWFRHALTRDAVVQTLVPPLRAAVAAAGLAAVDAAYPDLPGRWRDVAADLAVQAGDGERAGELLAASGSESLARGALSTAIQALRAAAGLLGPGPERSWAQTRLVEALALAGRADEAISEGNNLIAELGEHVATARARALVHVRLARAAVTATRWDTASQHLTAAAGLLAGDPDAALTAEVLALEADAALAGDDHPRARRLAERALRQQGASPEVLCHALEVIGRSRRLDDLVAAREAFERALRTAERTGLPFWRLRALHELGTIELLDHVGTARLTQARQTAAELGALSTAAVLDLQLAAACDARFEPDQAAAHASSCLAISERLGLHEVRAKALYFMAESSALRADRELTERYVLLTLEAAPEDAVLAAFCWGGGRAMAALLRADQAAALEALGRGVAILRDYPHAEPANFRSLWPLLLAATGDDRAAGAIEEARQAGIAAFFFNGAMLGYADAIMAGRAGDPDRATRLAAAAETQLANFRGWADIGQMYAAEAALQAGWGDPQRWLTQARQFFAARGYDRLARRCEGLLGKLPPGRRAAGAGVTSREADVLGLIAEGLSNKEIAARLYLSPRTVEKHVESLLRKTGARSRTQLLTLAGPRTGPGQGAT